MLLIIAHHFVVHSGLLSQTGPIYSTAPSLKTYFFLCFGAFGKTAINCFVLITGYFMCQQKATLKKYVKLFFEVVFYRVLIGVIFASTDIDNLLPIDYVKMVTPFSNIGTLFVDSFLAFYLLIPFFNIFIKNATKKQHFTLCLILIALFSGLGSIKLPGIHISIMNYVSWFTVLYLIAAYIRLNPCPSFEKKRICGTTTLIFFLLACASVVFCFENRWQDIYYFVSDSNEFIAFALGLSIFMLFKNIPLQQHKWINILAQGSFAVLLIHDNSVVMQKWLWIHTIDAKKLFTQNYSPILAITVIICIFLICSLLDQIRIHLIENKIFNKLE